MPWPLGTLWHTQVAVAACLCWRHRWRECCWVCRQPLQPSTLVSAGGSYEKLSREVDVSPAGPKCWDSWGGEGQSPPRGLGSAPRGVRGSYGCPWISGILQLSQQLTCARIWNVFSVLWSHHRHISDTDKNKWLTETTIFHCSVQN